jgi:hypothetical protein
LIAEKDKGVPEKEDRPIKYILKTLLTINIQEATRKISHQSKAPQINLEKLENHTFLYLN